MGSWVIRALLFLICGISGYFFGAAISRPAAVAAMAGGLILAALTILLEQELKKVPAKSLLGSFVGLIFGILFASLVSNVFFRNVPDHQDLALPLLGILCGICGYIGLQIGLNKGDEFNIAGFKLFSKTPPPNENGKILDTSVIIDGRIADITETGFVEGPIVIPQFVLSELQHIADSSDPVKRTRGKRGLEVLHHIQKQAGVDVKITDTDYPSIREVDSKLVELAKELRGKIVTNDSNLNKVAALQGISVLNINELANSLKPVVLPGEEMNVKILKEGKEMGQGVAYLDDGTMIVVDNGRRQIGRTVDVIVTSVLQTPAGRMIFARLKEDSTRESRSKESFYPLDSEL
jgi:uncharacterized protein YacL